MSYFSFTDSSRETFVIRLDDQALVAHARALLAGTTEDGAHIAGTIVKSPAGYNIGWSYRLDPKSIEFFDMSTEVGDSTMRYVQDHIKEVGGELLPGSRWTGWSSELVAELKVRSGHGKADHLVGTTGADLLRGKGGNDRLFGKKGDDHLVGGDGNDRLSGGDGADKIAGNAGRDKLSGGFGNDALFGGAGRDAFIFDTGLDAARNVDTIAGFSHADDSIWLDRNWFSAAGDADGKVRLASSAFWASNSGQAHDDTDRILYDKTDGHLYYDADGKGGEDRVQFADLAAHLKIDAGDFFLIA